MNRISKCIYSLAMVLGIALPAFAAAPPSFKHENSPKNLKAYFQLMHETVHTKRDLKQGTLLFQALLPDPQRIGKALKDDVTQENARQILAMHQKMSVTEDIVSKLARPEQRQVQVHSATTEDLVRFREGTAAYKEFPGGAKRVAEQVLRPGTTFYEVEYVAPGKDAGMKYHLLYWDGKQWSMLGPVWRAIK